MSTDPTGRDAGRRSGPAVVALALVVAVSGSVSCTHRQVLKASPPDVASARPATDGRQALLRVRYRGLDGRGRVRLTVRVLGEVFQLAAADAFGRQLWTFAGDGGRSRLLDHRQHRVCDYSGEIAVPAIALADLPVSMLPAVLLGDLPIPPGDESGGSEIDRTDAVGRRWTATLADDGRPLAWTLWEGGRPLVWWRATGDGAILSHREGAQVLWTVVAEEPLSVPPPLPAVPPGYADGDCDAQALS